MQESNWSEIRKYIYKRDGGKCRICGWDIAKMAADLDKYFKAAQKTCAPSQNRSAYGVAKAVTLSYALTMHGSRARTWPFACWAADHIRPISEGGDCLSVDNARLLCLECHDRVTAELRKRLAERRKRHRFLPLFSENP